MRALAGALGFVALLGLGGLGSSETAAKKKQRKWCQKQCKKTC